MMAKLLGVSGSAADANDHRPSYVAVDSTSSNVAGGGGAVDVRTGAGGTSANIIRAGSNQTNKAVMQRPGGGPGANGPSWGPSHEIEIDDDDSENDIRGPVPPTQPQQAGEANDRDSSAGAGGEEENVVGRYWNQFVGAILHGVEPCYHMFGDGQSPTLSPIGASQQKGNPATGSSSRASSGKNRVDLENAMMAGIRNANRTNTQREDGEESHRSFGRGGKSEERDHPSSRGASGSAASGSNQRRSQQRWDEAEDRNDEAGGAGGIRLSTRTASRGKNSTSGSNALGTEAAAPLSRKQSSQLTNRKQQQRKQQQPPPRDHDDVVRRQRSDPQQVASAQPQASGLRVVPAAANPPVAGVGAGEVVDDPTTFPFRELVVTASEVAEIIESVSELTMKSHSDAPDYGFFPPNGAKGGQGQQPQFGGNRRMAYYAVGKQHAAAGGGTSSEAATAATNQNNNTGGGNNASSHRRCYFTGRLICPGEPFYAGSVQQGLRTLVVFCLPSSLDLPKQKRGRFRSAVHRRENADDDNDGATGTAAAVMDDAAREELLSLLPDPTQGLLDDMRKRYPEQFSTLPVQVRSPHCWRLFVKFCFFSGLPIAEGEMHYRIKAPIQLSSGVGEEVILSHEVMEAVNGEQSADILRLPNKKTFAYLRKHYAQQSGKLDDGVFHRTSWEVVLPEC